MTVYLVPPPNNTGWPEVSIYEELVAAGGVPLFPLGQEVSGKGYSLEAAVNLNSAFLETLMRFPFDDGDTLLFCEGLSAAPVLFRTLADLGNLGNVRLVGLMHGGLFVPGDTLSWDARTERAVVSQYDLTIAPTEYVANLQRLTYAEPPVEVVQWPLPSLLFEVQDRAIERIPSVVFPHRPVAEKGIELFREVASLTDHLHEQFSFHELRGLSKQALYECLSASTVIFASATMETYGVAVEEGIALGCCPVLNHHPVYEELHGERGVHWHDGTVESVVRALGETLVCERDHKPLQAEESQIRAKRILEVSAQ